MIDREAGASLPLFADAKIAAPGGAPKRKRTKNDLGTPKDVLQVVKALGPIALDPCSNQWAKPIVGAVVELDVDRGEDGLAADWLAISRGGLVYVNPPYGHGHMDRWVAKVRREAACGVEIVMLVKGDHSTDWWEALRERCDAICYWRKRIAFEGGPHGSGNFPSAFFYFGRRAHLFAHVFAQSGDVRVI